jgi:hypothetical protein
MEWAREHKVRPPEFAIADARRTGIDLAWLEDMIAHGTVTHLKSVHGMICAVAEKPAAEPGVAGSLTRPGKLCCCTKRHQNSNSNSTTTSRVIGWKALNCQGHSANWLAALPTLISANREQSHELPLIEWLGPALSENANRSGDLPAIPPPRRA